MGSAKKDFDKEYIYNLIMPSGPALTEDAPDPVPETDPSTEAEGPARDSLSLLKDRLHQTAAPAIPLRPAKELVLVNLMEQLVIDRLDEVFAKFNCCRCDRCKRDVAALALNFLKPHYIVAEPDTLPGLIEALPTKEVSSALVKAILQVKNHPRH